jgi:hypothetical protein
MESVNSLHAGSCYLANSVSPGATVAVVQRFKDRVNWSSATAPSRCGTVPAVDVAGMRRWPVEYVAQVRNREGGYWFAASDPEAAGEAYTGS